MASRPIDEKIVVMKLENEQFKKRAAETTGIFGKLKNAFSNIGSSNLNKITQDMSNLQRSANGVNLNGLASSVDAISSRFSTLGVIATTALANITNKAVNAGLALQRSLTTQQITDGFREYEMKMGSIQTILSNTEWLGTDLDDVKVALGELNDYADKTIYNFAQMTQNIGRFTAAGASLEDATVAIKGMGNLAATAGANTEQLNRAMYQVSQALAGGSFQLMDWNSIEEASMGGKKTKDALMETAEAMGINIDRSKKFRETLKDGWLTSEVFLETMKKFGEDESMIEAATSVRTFTGMMDALKESIGSGWAETWEIVFGDFEQAKIFWTAVNDLVGGVFQKQTDARNEFLQGLADSGGLESLANLIINIGTPIVQIFKSIGEAFRLAFPPKSPDGIINAISSLANLTTNLRLSEGTVENVTTIFRGMFSIISSGIEIVKMFATALFALIPGFDSAGGGILDLVARIFELPIAFNEYLKTGALAEKVTAGLATVFGGLGSVLSFIGNGFRDFARIVGDSISIFASGDFTGSSMSKESPLVAILLGLRKAFESTFNFIGNIDYGAIWGGMTSFFDGIGDTFTWVQEKMTSFVNFFKSIIPTIADNQGWILAGGGIAALSAIIWKAWEMVRNLQSPFKMVNDLTEVVESVGDALGAFTLGIHVKSLLTIALAVGVLAVSLKLLSDLDAGQITTGLYMIVGSLTALVGALTIMSKFDITGSFGATLAIVGMSVAIGALAGAVKYLSTMSYSEITKGLIGLIGILGALTGAIVLMSKFGGAFAVGALQFVAIAAAITILISAINQIKVINPGDITKGLTTLGILLAELALFIKLASSRATTFTASAAGILATSGAILLMVQAIKQMQDINAGDMIKGLASIGVLLTMLGAFVVVANGKGLMSTGAGLILMAGALNALMIPILALGNTPLDTLAKGLIAMGVALTALAVTSKIMTSAIPAAIAIGLLAVSLNLLIIPIAALGAMPWQALALGIAGVTVALLAIGGVAILLGAATLPILGFGVAILALGAGMALLGKGLVIFSTMAVASMTVAITAIGAFITGFIALLPAITDLMLKIGNAMLDAMSKMFPKIIDAIGELILMILGKAKEFMPKILDLVGEILLGILTKLGDFIIDVVEVVADFLLALINTIGDYIPKFIKAGADIIVGFFEGLSNEIPAIIQSMSDFVVTLISSMAATVDENGPLFINSIMNLMGEVVEVVVIAGLSVVEALFGWIPGVSKITEEIGKTAGKYIEDNFKAFEIGDTKGNEFASGVSGTSNAVSAAGEAIAKSGLSGAGSVDASDTGSNFGIGFANGISSSRVLSSVFSSAKSLANAAYNTIVDVMDIHSPSRETYQLGEHTGQGYANGIESKGRSIVEALFPNLYKAKETNNKAVKAATAQGEAVGQSTVKGISKGVSKASKPATKKAKTTAKKTAKDVADAASKAFNDKMDTLEYKFKMEEINEKQYIASLKKLRTEYAKYPKLVREVNLEIKKLEDDLEKQRDDKAKAAIQREKDVYNKRKAIIDDRKYYDTMSMKQELEAWERMQKRYKEGTEERKEADREVYRLKKEMHQKIVELNEDYLAKVKDVNQQLIEDERALNQEYEDAVTSRANDLKSSLGDLFAEVTEKSDVSGRKLMDNLRGQINMFMTWSQNIQYLANQGIDQGLLEELRQMGPSAASEIKALTTLSNLELTEYSNLWKAKSELARTQAMGELQPMKEDTVKQIEELRETASAQLDEYKKEWLAKMREIRFGVPNEFGGLDASMEDIGESAMKGLLKGLKDMSGPLLNEAKSIANSVSAAVGNALKISTPVYIPTGKVVDQAKTEATKATDAITNAVDNLNLTKEIKVKAIVETVMPEDQYNAMNVKMKANTVVPDVSHTNNTLSNVKTPTKTPPPHPPSNGKTGDNNDVKGLTSAINSLVDKPQTTQVFIDGQKITEVVSRRQYNNNNLGAMTKGVVG